jgi:hypothetical protein
VTGNYLTPGRLRFCITLNANIVAVDHFIVETNTVFIAVFPRLPAPGQSVGPGTRPTKVIINTLLCWYKIGRFQSVPVLCPGADATERPAKNTVLI